ncbi:MAG: hypothetical protein JWP29_4413 [Rhodoferax sp.]|nr:hypothetical protein [Rhodoferax sp.]
MSDSRHPARRALITLLLAASTGLLPSCATLPTPVPGTLTLRLSPASLGRPLALQQQLTVNARGQVHRFDVFLEADNETVRLAVLNLGQTVARLDWDGTSLMQTKAAWWPAAVSGERVLSDLQLMLWPTAVIAAALPRGWSLDEATPGQRTLRQGRDTVATVTFVSATVSALAQLREGYTIRVESRVIGAPP